jgi:hypothetical protein
MPHSAHGRIGRRGAAFNLTGRPASWRVGGVREEVKLLVDRLSTKINQGAWSFTCLSTHRGSICPARPCGPLPSAGLPAPGARRAVAPAPRGPAGPAGSGPPALRSHLRPAGGRVRRWDRHVYRYVTEAVEILAALAPDLPDRLIKGAYGSYWASPRCTLCRTRTGCRNPANWYPTVRNCVSVRTVCSPVSDTESGFIRSWARAGGPRVLGGRAQIQVSSHILASQSACGMVCPV